MKWKFPEVKRYLQEVSEDDEIEDEAVADQDQEEISQENSKN